MSFAGTDQELEQLYYEVLTRTDHPVFRRDFSAVQEADSPFNSILNRVVAKALVRLRRSVESVQKNSFIHTLDADSIPMWEDTYFGYVKTGFAALRIDQLLSRFNSKLTMSVPDVVRLAQQITGQTPYVIRNVNAGGWILGRGALGFSTIFPGNTVVDAQRYIVVFSKPVNSDLIARLDEELTKIEKGGSTHKISSPRIYWVIGSSALGTDTLLGG